jgi:hypothetical protein
LEAADFSFQSSAPVNSTDSATYRDSGALASKRGKWPFRAIRGILNRFSCRGAVHISNPRAQPVIGEPNDFISITLIGLKKMQL